MFSSSKWAHLRCDAAAGLWSAVATVTRVQHPLAFPAADQFGFLTHFPFNEMLPETSAGLEVGVVPDAQGFQPLLQHMRHYLKLDVEERWTWSLSF